MNEKNIPENCWTCPYSVYCYASYGEGGCKYKLAIENAERQRGVDSDGS